MEELYYTHEEKYLCALEEINFGEPAKAKIMLEQLLADEPGYGRAYYLLGHIYKEFYKDHHKAKELLGLCIRMEPLFADAYYEYLYVLRMLNERSVFDEVYEKALQVTSACKSCLHKEAAAYAESNKDLQRALFLYRKASEENLGNCHSNVDEHISRIREKMNPARTYIYHIS